MIKTMVVLAALAVAPYAHAAGNDSGTPPEMLNTATAGAQAAAGGKSPGHAGSLADKKKLDEAAPAASSLTEDGKAGFVAPTSGDASGGRVVLIGDQRKKP